MNPIITTVLSDRWSFAVLALVLLSSCTPAQQTRPAASGSTEFFVATNGNDGWSGRLAAPNGSKTDGPFATLSRGLKAVRDSRQASGVANPLGRVLVRGGHHFLRETLILKPEDSRIELAGFAGERAIISAGRPIKGWKTVTREGKNLWAAEVPEARAGKWMFRELWVNGLRATRARHPNKGYLPIEAVPDKVSTWTQGHTRFKFRDNDLKAWSTVTNAEVVVMTRWVESRLPVLGIDETERLVRFGKRSVFELAPGDQYYVEHAFELLDQPGEWYLDASGGMLYYMPRPNEQLDRVEAIAPVLSQIVRLEGQPESGRLIDRITLRSLTFSHSEWYFPEGFDSAKTKPEVSPAPEAAVGGFAQAAIGVPGAVWGEGVRQSLFENCTFANLGSYGLELARGCQSNRIIACEFAHLGAGGMRIGETAIRQNAAEQSGGNVISDCRIHDGGKMFHSAIGVWIGQSPGNRIAHNAIYNFYYTGISIGWTWGYGPALASNNIVEFNHVHHIGVQSDGDGPILSDMGGIYTLGKQPGTTIRNNLWHDIAGHRYGGWGIYFDEGSSGILAESNLVYRTTHGGFHQHYGETNIVRNNLFAFARDHQVQRTRVEPHVSFSFVTNVVYFDSGQLLAGDWAGDKYHLDWNLYFDRRLSTNANALTFAGAQLEKWRERGHDLHSVIADPRFVQPPGTNFTLQPDSPAYQLGFRPIQLGRVGPRGEAQVRGGK